MVKSSAEILRGNPLIDELLRNRHAGFRGGRMIEEILIDESSSVTPPETEFHTAIDLDF
ncbi:MAG: hypothetical protein IPJ30_24125 [Acidobacteria bacterium]|nr:hypothetical protein [Acidobacteriota bacterium]